MFESTDKPRVFGIAPGIDFPKALANGLLSRMENSPPQDMAHIQLVVNTRRMQRRLREIFDNGPALLLPKIQLLTDLDTFGEGPPIPPAVSPLRRRLELISLVSGLLERQQHLAPHSSLYGLTDSLAELMAEMQGEGVAPETIANLDVSDQSGHWQNAQTFIRIAQTFINQSTDAPDPEARQRQMVERLAESWQKSPPAHPVIIAGSTGSRGTTMLLMKAVAALPQGALILPGFDFDMPAPVWSHLDDALMSEDHPQYRFHKIMKDLNLRRGDIAHWDNAKPASSERNALISLSLRPAPVTHAWRSEGAKLQDLDGATSGLTLLNAPSPRIEALAIAMRLREAAENGQTAALITPDRMLTRQVTAALDQWDILPDDSAGTPLHLSPPGRFLRHVAGLFVRRLDAEALLTLLKHPLTHSTDDRNMHALNTQRLELKIRRHGMPYPDPDGISKLMATTFDDPEKQAAVTDWSDWVGRLVCDQDNAPLRALGDWVDTHIALAEALAGGLNAEGTGGLWQKKAGQKAREVIENLSANAGYGTSMSAADYADLARALLSNEEVRDRDKPHSQIMIWGTLEARVQGADLVILGGLNEGTWPEAPPPDPWLNRAMRNKAGLLLPERRIGLSAHDYQQAVAAPEVWLSRAIRTEDAATIASRWLNRLSNLLGGLPAQGGPEALEKMTNRGDDWLAKVDTFERVVPVPAASRPSPRPPVSARPRKLSVTEIKRLVRDPYAIYAKHVLRLKKIGPLVQTADALMRGNLAHDILERFVKDSIADPALLSKEHFLNVVQHILNDGAPWPAARAMWFARLAGIAEWFVNSERHRRETAIPIAFEDDATGVLNLTELGFTLTARADRIDRDSTGEILIYDYKTGTPPSQAQQEKFDKQLLIEAAMIEEGAFSNLPPAKVSAATFIGLGTSPKEVMAPINDEKPNIILKELRDLISAYLDQNQGFTSRRMMEKEAYGGDYDQLARYGEWDTTLDPTPEDLT